MFPYRCETFTTANVSVLNVFKTSVDTINASSITSDMTIGANLNGGSLTLGSANSTVNVSGNTINIGAPSNIINVGAQVNRTGLISIGSNSASTTATGGLNLGSVSSGTGSVQLANGTSQTANIIIGNGNAVVTGSDKIIIGKSGKTVSISGATTLDNGTLNLSNSTINVNSPLTVGYNPSAITAGQIGYSIKYTWVSGVIPNGSSFTFGSFTNTPVGIYLLTVGTFTAFAFDPLDRLNMGYSAITNITFLSSSTTMEFGGNALTKMGIGYSVPISITNSTNQLTVSGSVSGSDVNYLEGASSLVRIA